MPDPPVISVLREGDAAKPDPFTICIVANPALEAPWRSGAFVRDPIMTAQAAFNACAKYIDAALFGNLPGQCEKLLAAPDIAPKVRVVSVRVSGLPATDANALVGQHAASNLLVARRAALSAFLATHGLAADVAYAVSGSASHTRASAWFTSDDDGRPGVGFTLDGVALSHRYYNLIPGTVAIHATATSLTALHEFGHALSSYRNGTIVDLYVDSNAAVNCKRGRPIPPRFANYKGTVLASDPSRDRLGYPSSWQSYHCELHALAFPAVMDNYWQAAGQPEQCEHDQITRQFLLDRVRAKVAR